MDTYLGDISLLDASPIRVRVLSARRELRGGVGRSLVVETPVPFQKIRNGSLYSSESYWRV
jgi:hypothetical protein